MPKLGICAALLVAVVGASSASEVWAADVTPTKAPSASAMTPRPCTDAADFVTTNCQLTRKASRFSASSTPASAGKVTVHRSIHDLRWRPPT